MNTLYLPLKKKWYNMIESGEKTEEYREIKQYWCKRLSIKPCCQFEEGNLNDMSCPMDDGEECEKIGSLWKSKYSHVRFSYGYTHKTMTFEIDSICTGKGNPEWGAPIGQEKNVKK